MNIALLIAVVALPLWLNVKATLLVCHDTLSEKRQKLAQFLFVWLIPLVGAIVILELHRREEKFSGTYPADKDPGGDFATSGEHIQTITAIIDGD